LRIAEVIELLQTAAPAFLKMAAGRLDMMRPLDQANLVVQPVQRSGKGDMTAICGDTVAFGGNADDRICVWC